MQFTGLIDKDNNETFHQDIVECAKKHRYVIERDDNKACFYLKGLDGVSNLGIWLVDSMSIVGNSYKIQNCRRAKK